MRPIKAEYIRKLTRLSSEPLLDRIHSVARTERYIKRSKVRKGFFRSSNIFNINQPIVEIVCLVESFVLYRKFT